MAPRLVVLGWDSATFDVIDPLMEKGRLPALASLMERGGRAPLRSTWPPMTDCAWTSAFTGRNAGGHGIFGSWYRAPGSYSCRYFSSRDRHAPALWELTDGVTHLVWNVPMAFPPDDIDGVMVAGYGAPPGARFCAPDAFQDELARRWRLDDLLDRAPHTTLERFRDDLVRGLVAQAEALVWASESTEAECVVAVWPHVDRAQHFFWRYRGTDHPLAGAVDDVYEAMDRATGELVRAFPDADFLVVSDHGAGTLKGDVDLGAWLVENGYAVPARRRSPRLAEAAWKLPPPIRRLARRVAPGLARRTVGATLSGQLGSFDWSQTRAFVGFHSDIWLNLEGREPQGVVKEAEADGLMGELRSRLVDLRDPLTGERAFGGVFTRDQLFSGADRHLGPDLMVDTWSTGYRIAPGRALGRDVFVEPAPLAGVEESWSADHRPVGIFVGGGPRLSAGDGPELDLLDLCPTALALLEQPVPEGLDGKVARGAIDASWLEDHPVAAGAPRKGRAGGGDYSPDEAEAVAAHLKDLGYIE